MLNVRTKSLLYKINTEPESSSSGSSMAENQAEDEDDEFFGDFNFVSSSNPNQNNRVDDDDDWGDFMDNFSQKQDFFGNSLQFQISNGLLGSQNPSNIDPIPLFSDPLTNPPKLQASHIESVGKIWEKPRGALPLSIFGDEEEESESDSVNPSFDDARDWNMFSPKPESTVKNGLNFGSENGIKDLIVNLYSKSEQIKNDNESNSNLVDENGDFDEEGWEFKDAFSESRGGDSDIGVKKVGEDSDLSGIRVESATQTTTSISTTTNNDESQVDEIMWGSTEGHKIMSGFRENGQHSDDWFVNSDGLSLNPTKIDNAFDFKSGVTTPNGHTSDMFSQFMESGTENGLNVGENFDSDENFCGFKDAFSENEERNYSPGQEEPKVADHSGVEMEVLTFNGEVEGDGKWSENHQGALPLSIFSNGKVDSDDSLFGQDLFSSRPTTFMTNGINSQVFSSDVSLNDLISNLYSQTEKIPTAGSTQQAENGFDSTQTCLDSNLPIGEDDFDENSWEFKDAFSEERAEDQSSVIGLGDIQKQFPVESKLKDFVDLYSRLKEESFLIANHHLDGLKKAQKVAALSGDDAQAMALHEEIQVAHEKLNQENAVSKEVCLEEHPTRNICVNELLEVTKEPKFQMLESEYHLSNRISLAEKDLSSAIGLFEHAISMVKVLTLGSLEDQSSYTTTWSKMISVCAQELKHGDFIWKQALQKNVHKQLLSKSQGQRYIVALGEIYRVVKILRTSVTLYKPWILSSVKDPTHIFSLLEDCDSVWSGSGLEEALQSISDIVGFGYNGTIKALLESIKFFHDLDVLDLQNHVSALQEPICRLSILSPRMVPDMKMVVWNGEHYFLTLANLWANLISSDPTKLPHIHVGL